MKKILGFTFLELVIAVLLIAALAAVAIPSFIERKKQANQDMAAQTVLKDAQFLGKWKSMYGTYSKSIDGSGGCPALPFRFAPESGDNPRLYYVSSADSNCTKDSFTLKVRPICGTMQEAVGVICLDQDGNLLKSSNLSCFYQNGGSPSINDCIGEVPDPSTNTINDNNNNGEVDPTINPNNNQDCVGFICDVKNCALHPESWPCEQQYYCQEIQYAQNQCSCYKPSTNGVEPSSDCKSYCSDPKNASKDICYCVLNPKDTKTCTGTDCKYHPWTPGCYIPPSPSPNPTSTATPTPTPTNIPTPSGGESGIDVCGNSYKCLKGKSCKGMIPGSDWRNYWSLVACNGKTGPMYVSGTTYAVGSKVLTDSCINYICQNSESSATVAPGGTSATVWMQCYSSCPLTNRYNNGDWVYNADCTQKYECINASLCNGDASLYAPGTGTEWSRAWRR